MKAKLYLRLLILISAITFGASCKNETLKKNVDQESKNQEDTVKPKEKVKSIDDKISRLFYMETDTVLSYETYNQSDDSDCNNWINNPKDVLDLANRFYRISGYEWNQCYGTFECGIKGELVLKGILYEYNLNAGGWMHLKSTQQEMYLGAKEKIDTSQFISIYYCDETWD